MGNCHGKGSNEDDDAMVAFSPAQDALPFEEFIEMPIEVEAGE